MAIYTYQLWTLHLFGTITSRPIWPSRPSKVAFVEIRKSLPDRLFGLQQKSVCSNFGDDFQAPHFILLTFISKMFRGKVSLAELK